MKDAILKNAATNMKDIVVFHMCINLFLFTFMSHCFAAYAAFFNLACLCERMWAIQLQTLTYWPIEVQGVFVASRLVTVTVFVVVVTIITRLHLVRGMPLVW